MNEYILFIILNIIKMDALITYLNDYGFTVYTSVQSSFQSKLDLIYVSPLFLTDFYIDHPNFFDNIKLIIQQDFPDTKALIDSDPGGSKSDLTITWYTREMYLELLPEEIILEMAKYLNSYDTFKKIKDSSFYLEKVLSKENNLKRLINYGYSEMKIYSTKNLNYIGLYNEILNLENDLWYILNGVDLYSVNVRYFHLFNEEIIKALKQIDLPKNIKSVIFKNDH